jgi:hypothetical protein
MVAGSAIFFSCALPRPSLTLPCVLFQIRNKSLQEYASTFDALGLVLIISWKLQMK